MFELPTVHLETETKDPNDTLGPDGLPLDGGMPKGPIPGILSDDKQTITFPDGNKWTKNAKKFDGIYKDPKYPDGYRISE